MAAKDTTQSGNRRPLFFEAGISTNVGDLVAFLGGRPVFISAGTPDDIYANAAVLGPSPSNF